MDATYRARVLFVADVSRILGPLRPLDHRFGCSSTNHCRLAGLLVFFERHRELHIDFAYFGFIARCVVDFHSGIQLEFSAIPVVSLATALGRANFISRITGADAVATDTE